ncbi:MAG: thiamine phosphate synthase [Actinomycetota bacterium]
MVLDRRSLHVYVVTSAGGSGRGHQEIAEAAIAGGATAVQLRAPELADEQLLPLASILAARCRDAGVLFVINDRVEVALACGAGGVHLGQHDDPAGARARLGSGPVLGVSVGSAGEARSAEVAGADYLGVTVWATATKPDAEPRGIDGVRSVVLASPLPVVGIGGIVPANAGAVLGAGAAGVAVISAVSSAPDPAAAVRELRRIVDGYRSIGEGRAHG